MKRLITAIIVALLLATPTAQAQQNEPLTPQQVLLLYPEIGLAQAQQYVQARWPNPPSSKPQVTPSNSLPVAHVSTPRPVETTVQGVGWDLGPWEGVLPQSVEQKLIRHRWNFVIDHAPNPPVRGYVTHGAHRWIVIYTGPSPSGRQQTWQDVADTIVHEVGHAIDHSVGTPAERAEWMRLRGLALWQNPPHNDLCCGTGQLAEALGGLAVGRSQPRAIAPLTSTQRALVLQILGRF